MQGLVRTKAIEEFPDAPAAYDANCDIVGCSSDNCGLLGTEEWAADHGGRAGASMLIKVGIFLPMIIALYNDAKMMKISDEESGNANLAHLAAQMGNAAMLQGLAERGGGFLSFPRVRGAAFPRSVAQLWSPWTVTSQLRGSTGWGLKSRRLGRMALCGR